MSTCTDDKCGYWAHLRSIRDVEENLAHWEHVYGIDWAIKINVAAECCWAAELRVTLRPNDPTGPDRSYTTYAAGADDPITAVHRCWIEMELWVTEQVEALPQLNDPTA